MPNRVRIIISGGGTGGHIFPAIAIANKLREKYDANILFVGAEGKMEMEKVPAAGYQIESLWISGIQRKLTLDNLSFPFKLISSMWKAKKILKKFDPAVVVGVGGFASGPMLRVANNNGVSTLIQEQNSYPGITNKLLAKKANKICVAYSGLEKYFPKEKILLTGNPVRQDILNLEGKKDKALDYFNLSQTKKTILIIGGSQGALSINKCIAKSIHKFIENDIQIIWQTGKTFFSESEKLLENKKDNGIRNYEFITKMDYAYAAADIIISRAGASSVSELCFVKKATVLVPYPYAAEDHQTKNAMALVNKNAAVLVADKDVSTKLIDIVFELIKNEDASKKLGKNIGELALKDSAEIIAQEIMKLANKN